MGVRQTNGRGSRTRRHDLSKGMFGGLGLFSEGVMSGLVGSAAVLYSARRRCRRGGGWLGTARADALLDHTVRGDFGRPGLVGQGSLGRGHRRQEGLIRRDDWCR